MKRFPFLAVLCLGVSVGGCVTPEVDSPAISAPKDARAAKNMPNAIAQSQSNASFARVEAVEVRGQDTFAVTIQSPDTGCDRYADWWEVLTEDGELLYRRVLAHSHVDEQPFTRSGGPVNVAADRVAVVRAHMHPTGYGTQAMRGTVATGFEEVILPEGFAAAVAEEGPQPPPCAF